MAQAVPYAANWKYYAELVREKAQRRAAIHVHTEGLRKAWDDRIPAAEALAGSEQALADITQAGAGGKEPLPFTKLLTGGELVTLDLRPSFLVKGVLSRGNP